MKSSFRALVVSFFLLFSILSFSQEHPAKTEPAQQGAHSAEQKQGQPTQAQGDQEKFGSQLAETSREAAGEEKSETAEFKQSASVKALARWTGLSLDWAYRLSIFLNFAILAVLIVLFSRSKLPAMFRTRTDVIQRGIREAQKASEDANRRLADIETRLSKLDTEVAQMRAGAESESAAEEERIKQAAELEKKKIVASAEAEISAAAKLARRELKSYAADLAISLAEKRINVDAEADRALVGNFVAQLNDPENPGKDGR